MAYLVTCSLCDFEFELDDLDDVIEFEDTHQNRYGKGHLVEFERTE